MGVSGKSSTWTHLIHTATYEIGSPILEKRKPRHREIQASWPRQHGVSVVGPGCGPRQGGSRIRALLLRAPRLTFPDTQLVRTGPGKASTGMNTSAKHTGGIRRASSTPALLRVGLRPGGFHRDVTQRRHLIVHGSS